jgi:hypothetical protein
MSQRFAQPEAAIFGGNKAPLSLHNRFNFLERI